MWRINRTYYTHVFLQNCFLFNLNVFTFFFPVIDILFAVYEGSISFLHQRPNSAVAIIALNNNLYNFFFSALRQLHYFIAMLNISHDLSSRLNHNQRSCSNNIPRDAHIDSSGIIIHSLSLAFPLHFCVQPANRGTRKINQTLPRVLKIKNSQYIQPYTVITIRACLTPINHASSARLWKRARARYISYDARLFVSLRVVSGAILAFDYSVFAV